MKDKRELARVWAEAKPSVRVGKGGIDTGVVAEVQRQLKKQRMIKVRFLRSALSTNAIGTLITEIATKTSSRVVGQRGFVIILTRKRR